MKDHSVAAGQGQGESSRETEGMEERENAENSILAIEAEALIELRDIGNHIVVGEHHAFWIPGTTAGENHRGKVFGFHPAPN